MKKLTGIVCLLALMLTLTACAGAGDWKYEDLPGDYAVWRINSQEIPLVCVDDDGLTAEPVVEGYVYAVAWDESTIYVQQRAEKARATWPITRWRWIPARSAALIQRRSLPRPARSRAWTRPILVGRRRKTGTRSMTGKGCGR